eukprot:Rhum_TRINITY_DN16488_c0_g1::Rhum_TRINITY_DN16488_c0_g1_i1::g.163327::m.163327
MPGVEFSRAHPLAFVIILPAMYITYLTAFDVEKVPLDVVFSFAKNLARANPALFPIIFWVACALHVGEALYVLKKAVDVKTNAKDAFLWFVQTVLVGYPSTSLFLAKHKKVKSS